MSHRPLAVLALLVGLALPAAAHRLAPSYLSLESGADGRVAVTWKTPQVVARGAQVEPRLPPSCRPLETPRVEAEGTGWVSRFAMDCGPEGLVGAAVGVAGLEASGTDALVHVALADGREVRRILTKEEPSFVIPERESGLRVFSDYLRLGVLHLLTGADHLLFVLGLMLLMPTRHKLLAAITSFTLGHSLTLALAALGVLGLPQRVVEVGIALTLVSLAAEALEPNREHALLVRQPWLAPAGFGLIHGLGFAGALAELGLPGHAIPLALFSFNVGLELGQLAVVATAWWAVRALVEAGPRWPRLVSELPATVIGTLGVFWCLQRGIGWLGF